jgi:hypothetical protein
MRQSARIPAPSASERILLVMRSGRERPRRAGACTCPPGPRRLTDDFLHAHVDGSVQLDPVPSIAGLLEKCVRMPPRTKITVFCQSSMRKTCFGSSTVLSRRVRCSFKL